MEANDTLNEETRSSAYRKHHWFVFWLCVAVVILAFALKVRPDQRVEFRFLPGIPLPKMCMTHNLFGTDCPGCGLTRSFIYLAEGNWKASIAVHHIGWLMAIATFIQFPYRLYRLSEKESNLILHRAAGVLGYGLLAILIVNWIIGIIR